MCVCVCVCVCVFARVFFLVCVLDVKKESRLLFANYLASVFCSKGNFLFGFTHIVVNCALARPNLPDYNIIRAEKEMGADVPPWFYI